MAGYSALEATNHILSVLNLEPVSLAVYSAAVTSSWPSLTFDGSDIGQAAYWLYRLSKEVQAEGFPCNTERWQSTLGTSGAITFPTGTLKVKPIGRNDYRRIVMRNNAAYDADLGTATFAAATYDFEIVKELDFVELDIDAQTAIIEKARKRFELTKNNNPSKQQAIGMDLAEAKARVERGRRAPDTTVGNTNPIIAGMGGGGQQ
jgi:hypothetical protein